MLVRNIFDQYKHDENRLTNALFQVLKNDLEFVRGFVEWANVGLPDGGQAFELACQSIPKLDYQYPFEEDEKRARNIPDGWIYLPEQSWALLVENKITAGLRQEQIDGHISRARQLGFNKVIVLVITADRSIPQELQGMVGAQGTVFWKPWSDLYIWLKSNNNGFLGRELIAYLELLEYKLHREGDSNVALTGFTGIPFGAEHPYNSIEAYAQLMSLVQALRSSEKLVHVYPHFSAEGRGNIEQDRPDVWDVLQMYPVPKDTKKKNWKFNNAPHFIIWLSREGLHIGVTLPNADKTGGWRRVTTSPHSLGNALGQVQSSAQHLAGKPSCFVALIQRHLPPKMPPRASNLKTDGRIEFDLDTFLPEQLDNKVKPKQGWYDAITNLLQSKGPENLELHLDLRYSYLSSSSSRILKSAQFIEESVDACIALHPWYRFLTESNVYKRTPA